MQHEEECAFHCYDTGRTECGFSSLRAGIRFPNTDVSEITAQDTDVALWIWTDKYVYTPGETLTLRATLKTNGDTQPYTLLAFRQNNQTGVRTYLPGKHDRGRPTFLDTR